MADPEIRPARPDEFAAAGEIVVAAYDTDGFLDDEPGYADVLRDLARRAEHAEVLVAVEDTGDVLGAVTVVRPGRCSPRFRATGSWNSGCWPSRRRRVVAGSVRR